MNLKVQAKLDKQFMPLSLVCREMRENTKENGQDIVIAVERNKGYTTTYKTRVYKDNTGHDQENFRFVERIAKVQFFVLFKIVFKRFKNNVGVSKLFQYSIKIILVCRWMIYNEINPERN